MKKLLPLLLTLAACAGSPPNLSLDSAPLTSPWTMTTIVPIGGTSSATMGADGVHIAPVRGVQSVCTGWEQGKGVTIAPVDGSPFDRFSFTAANATEVFTATAHGMSTADGPIRVHSDGALPTGLSAGTDYWIIKINANTFYLAATRADAVAGTHLAISDDGTGTQTLSNPVIGTNVGVEDVKCVDVDGDGNIDAVSSGESGKKIKIHWGPNFGDASSTVVDAATNVQRWMQLDWGDVTGDGQPDIIAGGKTAGSTTSATWGYFTVDDHNSNGANPREHGDWTYHVVGYTGWTMALRVVDWDLDGDGDVFLTDRVGGQEISANKGAWWYEQTTSGQFAAHQIAHIDGDTSFGDFADVDSDGDYDVVAGNRTTLTLYTQTQTNLWSASGNLKPADTGDVHGTLFCDLGDGLELVTTYALTQVDDSWVGIVALDGSGYTDVSGPATVIRKPDQAGCLGSSIVVSEGGDGVKTDDLGVVRFDP